MKSNLTCTLTLGVFLVCALYTAWLSVRTYFSGRELQQVQYQYMRLEQTHEALQSLASEALEFSKKNPAMNPILQRFDIKPKGGGTNAPTATQKPAAK
jgi:hypothetical protein